MEGNEKVERKFGVQSDRSGNIKLRVRSFVYKGEPLSKWVQKKTLTMKLLKNVGLCIVSYENCRTKTSMLGKGSFD